MNRMKWIVGVVVLVCVVAQGTARAADATVGKWVCKSDTLKLEMEFTADGHCSAIASANGKTSSFTGTYKATATEMVITPKDSTAVTYAIKLDGDKMVMSGGDIAAGKVLNFDREAAPQAPANATPEKPAADKPADKSELPGGPWDLKALNDHFTVVKTKVDEKKITWLLERTDAEFRSYDAAFYDEDDVKLGTTVMTFEPNLIQTAKGERTRGSAELLPPDVMKKVKRITIVAR